MEDLNLVIPLIDLIETNNQNDIFWAYNNYAKQFQRIGFLFKEEDKTYCGSYFDSKEYDKTRHKFYVGQNDFLGFKTLIEETLLLKLFEGSEEVINDGTGFKIGLFSAKFQIDTLKNNFDLGNYIEGVTGYFDRIEKCNLDEKKFCPDSKELDLVAKYFLGIIEPENLFDFLKFHLLKYKGDCSDFLKHTIELTSEIWNNSTPKNLERKIKFKEWVNYSVDRFELDKIKLGLTSINSEQTEEGNLVLSQREIALIYHYEGWLLTDENSNNEVSKYLKKDGTRHKSGKALIADYRIVNGEFKDWLNQKNTVKYLKKIIPLLQNTNGISDANEDLKQAIKNKESIF